ncbi:hypothetical protein HOH87_05950 [bacterium]|jgi:hypothetical protein|nr:hypothetical protein [bacterium]
MKFDWNCLRGANTVISPQVVEANPISQNTSPENSIQTSVLGSKSSHWGVSSRTASQFSMFSSSSVFDSSFMSLRLSDPLKTGAQTSFLESAGNRLIRPFRTYVLSSSPESVFGRLAPRALEKVSVSAPEHRVAVVRSLMEGAESKYSSSREVLLSFDVDHVNAALSKYLLVSTRPSACVVGRYLSWRGTLGRLNVKSVKESLSTYLRQVESPCPKVTRLCLEHLDLLVPNDFGDNGREMMASYLDSKPLRNPKLLGVFLHWHNDLGASIAQECVLGLEKAEIKEMHNYYVSHAKSGLDRDVVEICLGAFDETTKSDRVLINQMLSH